MSLLVWLPLDNSLKNNGLSDIIFTNNNTTNITISDSGKIGKCYQRATKQTAGRISSDKTVNLNGDITMCCWAMVTDAVTSTGYAHGILTNHSHANNTGLGITAKIISDTDYRISCSTGNGSARTWDTYYGTTNIKNTWHHLALTYSKSDKQLLLYVDGNIEYTLNNYNNASRDDYIMLFEWSTTYDNSAHRCAVKLNDVRVYSECLSQKQVKEIAKGLIAHYKFDNFYETQNLIVNGFGELGSTGWSNNNISTTELPSGVSNVKESFYNGNMSTVYTPIDINHTYNLSVYIKSSGATSGTTYPSLHTFDIDKKFIEYYECKDGFRSATKTTLSQELNPGDTVIHATDLSQWTTDDDYAYHVAIFRYQDSTGYIYPDLEYTQDSPTFGTRTDKSHIDKTNNTITLNSAFTGQRRPAGTVICQSTEGSTYFYPFGGIALSSLSNWTLKSTSIVPRIHARLKYARYIKYSTYSNSYHAAIKLEDTTMPKTLEDVSGYGHNLTASSGSSCMDTDTKRYTYSRNVSSQVYQCDGFNTKGNTTMMAWIKPTGITSTTQWLFHLGSSGTAADVQNGVYIRTTGITSDGGSVENSYSTTITNNTWYHIASVVEGTSNKLYVNGELVKTNTASNTLTKSVLSIADRSTGSIGTYAGYQLKGSISDYRFYVTALTEEDIKKIYKVGAYIDDKNNTYSFEIITNKSNMMSYINDALNHKKYTNGLSAYTQANCQVTLTDEGYRIYRPPNKSPSVDGNTMWGGLRIQIGDEGCKDNLKNALTKGHKYIIIYEAKGQTSSPCREANWTNQMGWPGGGLIPNPSGVQQRYIPENFQSDEWQTFFYKWNLTDDVYKVCTSAYGSFVLGKTYLSYNHFQIRWDYISTGELGTDIYLRNIRMYDITDLTKPIITEKGILNIDAINELEGTIVKMKQMEINSNNYIEI